MLRGSNLGVSFVIIMHGLLGTSTMLDVHKWLVVTLHLGSCLEAAVEVVAAALFRRLRPPLPTVLELSRWHAGPLNHNIQLSRIFTSILQVLSGHRFSHTLSVVVLFDAWFAERFGTFN